MGVKQKIRENRDLIFGYSSFLGLLIGIATIFIGNSFNDLDAKLLAVIIGLVVSNVSIALAALYILRKYDRLIHRNLNSDKVVYELEEEIENHKLIHNSNAKILHNINHQSRKLYNELFYAITQKNVNKLEEIEKSFEKYILYLIENVKEVFDVITGDQCAVCIKILDPGDYPNDTKIKTHFRDAISYRERNKVDLRMQDFYYFENTAFRNILDEDCIDTHYFSNNLSEEKTYINKNDQWQEHYNATVVVPISYNENSDSKHVIIGFICVDNKSGGFDKKTSVNLLSSIADQTFLLYNLLSEYKNLVDK